MQPEIVLYGNTPMTSPYVMTVFVALEEKQLPYRLELLDLERGDQHRPDFIAHSITNRVPTLRIADAAGELWLSESAAIVEYLEERFPPPAHAALYPRGLAERARVRMVQGIIRSEFSIADVDLAILLQRLVHNGDALPAHLADYANHVWQRPSIQKWLGLTQYRKRK
jgi:glutathione S-transferase